MKNTEIWPWSEEHILRKDNPVHWDTLAPKCLGTVQGEASEGGWTLEGGLRGLRPPWPPLHAAKGTRASCWTSA